MKKEYTICISDSLESEKGDDTIEVTTNCTMKGSPDNYTIEYDEIFGEGMSGHTVIEVKNKSCATIIRSGSIISEMTVEKGKRHLCMYSTPYGDIPMGISAKEVSSSVDKNGGELRLSYEIDFNSNYTASKQMLIKIGEFEG